MSLEISTLTKEASAGDIEAQLQLAELYETGFGVPTDRGQAAYWYRKAAEQGAAKAQSTLGQMYIRGIGVPEDYTEAVVWLEKAAWQGEAVAEANLAWCYQMGLGVEVDLTEALKWVFEISGIWSCRIHDIILVICTLMDWVLKETMLKLSAGITKPPHKDT